jgi:mRNA interferase MazF
MVAKMRPVLILSIPFQDHERAVYAYVPRTKSIRGTRFEVLHQARGLDDGAFDAQGIANISEVQLVRRAAVVDDLTLSKVEAAVKAWLGLE